MKVYSVMEKTIHTSSSIIVMLVILFFFHSATAQEKNAPDNKQDLTPKNLRVLDEHKDAQGNMVRTIQYTKGPARITETLLIPPCPPVAREPIKPDTLNKDSVMVIVDKSHYCLQVYYKKRMVRSYKAVFGPKPLENKCVEGDRCTPEGWFRIINKNPASRYDKFMLLDYPNEASMARFNELKQKGKIPENAGTGGNVGIHGIWKGGDDMIEMGVGWTDGCIALKNKDVDELYTLVGIGTRVYIRK
jgi:lipoprotein-anchoring transpeptidase ErfK/SrfK